MRIGLAGQVSTEGLTPWFGGRELPETSIPGSSSVTQLAVELRQRGHELLIVSLSHALAEPLTVKGDGVTLRLCPSRLRHRGRDAYRAERRYLRAALAAERLDVIHAQWTYEYALAALGTGTPTLITVRDWPPTIFRMRPDPYRAVKLLMAAATLARVKRLGEATHLTTVSPYIQDRLTRYGLTDVDVIPNGIADTRFRQHERNLSDSPRIVSINHGFTQWKNVESLLRAFRPLADRHDSWRLLLVGRNFEADGPAQQWASQRALDKHVEFCGPLPHDRSLEILDGADLLVHPSLEESFGNVLLEAMALRVPTIGGLRSGAVPWILAHGTAGALCDVTSPDELASEIEDVLSDEHRWQAFSDRGWQRAWQEFRLTPVVDRYLTAYETLLHDRSAHA
jgi:L-malate glycosyltransferase